MSDIQISLKARDLFYFVSDDDDTFGIMLPPESADKPRGGKLMRS